MPVVLTLKKRTNSFARMTHTPPGTSGSAESWLNPCGPSYRSDRTHSIWKTVCRITPVPASWTTFTTGCAL